MPVTSPPVSPVKAAWILAAIAVVVRVIAITVFFEDRTYFNDEINYLHEADQVIAGGWLGDNTKLPPGPIYFLAAAKAAGLELFGARVVQALLGGAAVFLTTLLAGLVFGPAVAWLSGLGAALYPYLIYISGVLYTQNQVIPLLLLVIYALYRRQGGGGARWLGAAGVGWGVAAMFMVPSILTAPVLGLWHAARMPRLRRGALDLALLAAVSVAALVPVTVRNYHLDHQFVFVSSMGGRAFFWANNPDIDPSERDPERWIEVNVTRVKEERLDRGWTHAQMDSALSARAKEYVRDNPGRFARHYAQRMVTMWSFAPRTFTKNEHTGGRSQLLATASSAPVILLGLIAMLVFLPRWRALFPFYAVPVVLTLAFSLFHTTVRYRLTVEPLLICLAAALLVRLIRPQALADPPPPPRSIR